MPFEYDAPPLGPQEVDVRVQYCRVCHSDLGMIDNDWGMSAYPLVPGHEVIGEVTAISSTRNKEEEARQLGASHVIATRGTDELAKAAKQFDFILSTVSADVEWGQFIEALAPEGRLCIVGLPESDLKLDVFSMINANRSLSGGGAGAPSDTMAMLEFCATHGVTPMCEQFDMKDVKQAVEHVRSGKVRYRAVLAQ